MYKHNFIKLMQLNSVLAICY